MRFKFVVVCVLDGSVCMSLLRVYVQPRATTTLATVAAHQRLMRSPQAQLRMLHRNQRLKLPRQLGLWLPLLLRRLHRLGPLRRQPLPLLLSLQRRQ